MVSTIKMSSTMQQYDDCIFLNRLGLTITGVWPLEQNASKFRIILQRVHRSAIYALMLFVLIPQWLDVYSLWGNIDANTETLLSNFFIFTIIMKLCSFSNSIHIFEGLSKTMRVNWQDVMKHSDNADKKRIMRTMTMKARIRSLEYGMMLIITAMMYTLMPMVSKNDTASLRDRNYPFFGRYFFDRNSEVIYILCYLSQLLTGTFASIVSFSIDGIFMVCMYHSCAQLRILQVDLIDLGSLKSDSHCHVIYLIQRHQKEIENVHALQSIFSIASLQQVLLSCLMICLNGFKLIISLDNQDIEMVMYIICLPLMFFQILFYCQPGNELILQSQSLDIAIQQSYWINLDQFSKRHLAFMIQRSQKPLTITAGKLYVLSLENFMKIVKSSMSALSVLQAVYRKDNSHTPP